MHRSTSSLVHRRGPVFWFRKSVPVDLIDRLGSSDIRRSLRTCNARVARQRAWSLVLLLEDAFAVLRDAGLTPGARDALTVVVGNLIDDFDRPGAQWSQRLRYQALLSSLVADHPVPNSDSVPVRDVGTAVHQTTTRAAAPSPALSAPSPMEATAGTPKDVVRAVIEAMRVDAIHPEARKPLTAHIAGYVASLRKKKRGEKYVAEVATKVRIFITAVGDKAVHEYSKDDLRAYRDLVDQMPKDAIKHLKTDDPAMAISLNAARAERLPPISATTVNAKYLTVVRGIFTYLVERGYRSENPASGVHSEQVADAEDLLDVEVRLPFSPDIEVAVFREASKKPKTSADYWWPRFNCRQGLRLQEFTQLCVSDFRMLHGRLCVDLLHFNFDSDPCHDTRRKELQLKSPAARRIFPVAQDLLEEGLTKLIEKRFKQDGPNARLFPNEEPDRFGNTSSALSKRANRQVRRVTQDRRVVAYSARHTFAQYCDEAGVPLAVRNMFMGHESGSQDGKPKPLRGTHVSGRYGSPLPTTEDFAWFDKIRFRKH